MTKRNTQMLGITPADPETINNAVQGYLTEHPITSGATAEQAAQIEKNTEDIAELKQTGGTAGADGKSAYQYAQDGGYTGTEEEFAAKMAEEVKGLPPMSEDTAGKYLINDGTSASWVTIINGEEVSY